MKRLKVLWKKVRGLNIPLYASQAGFFIALSVFPTLVLLMNLLRYVGLGAETLTEMLHGVLPTALMSGAQKLIFSTYQRGGGTALSLSAVTVLWSASRGIHGLRQGLDHIYGTACQRGWFLERLVSTLYTVALLLVVLVMLSLQVVGTNPLLLLGLQTGLFLVVFAYLPGGKRGFWEGFPGAVLAALGWLVFTQLYSLYVEWKAFSSVYESVYGVALALLWLYFCLCILFCGAALNRYLQEKRD